MHINFKKTRQFCVFIVSILLFSVLFARLFYIQIISNKHLGDLADKQHKIFVKLEPKRGTIYDRRERILAMYMDAASIYAVPKEIADKKGAARALAEEFGADESILLARLNRDNYFAWIKRRIDPVTAKNAKCLDIKGVYITSEPKRFYPGGKLLCHALGMTGVDNKGLEGLELYYEKELGGEYGWRRSYRDAKRRELVSLQDGVLPARDGTNLVLTIDEVIQHIIETEVDAIARLYKPSAVSIVAVAPQTGEVLGLANYPAFDPNEPSLVNARSVKNRAIADSFEPGSVFKIVTAAAALEEGIVDFDSEFFCEDGVYKIGNRILHDHKPHGRIKFREIIEKSSNIGTVKVAGKLGKEKLAAYIKKFNFNDPTGIDLPGEASGIMREPSGWSYVDMTTIPMGQGVAVTALQITSLVSAIANNGVLMRPYVVKKFLNEEGATIRETGAKPAGRAIREETARKVKELLEGVVERGTGKRAAIDGFRVCGKTGTAQKVKPGGGYYKSKYVATFAGFGPAAKPAVALAVCVNDPQGKYFGGEVCAPAFKNIMEKIFSYMEIESERSEIKRTS